MLTRYRLNAVFVLLGMFVLAACGNNPVRVAETPEQKAWALYGVFVVYQEQAVAIIQDAATPEDVSEQLRSVVLETKPKVDTLFDLAQAYIASRDPGQRKKLAAYTKFVHPSIMNLVGTVENYRKSREEGYVEP